MAAKALSHSASSVLYTDRRDFYLSPNQTKELWTDATPFLTIASNQTMESTPDPDFKLFEHRSGWIKQEMSINSGSPDAWATNGDPGSTLAADASVAVDGLTGLTSTSGGDSSLVNLMVEIWDSTKTSYKGVAFITAFSSGIKLQALGNPRAANNRMVALADNDVLVVIGSVFGEGSVSPEAFSDEIEVVYNSCGISRTPVEITGTLYHQTKLRGYSNELARLRKEKNFEHKMQKERAFLFGVRKGGIGSVDLASDNVTNLDSFGAISTDASGAQLRSTMGIIPALYRYGTSSSSSEKQNIFNIVAGAYTYTNFVDDCEKPHSVRIN